MYLLCNKLAFIAPKYTMQVTGNELQPSVLFSCPFWLLYYQHAKQHVHITALVTTQLWIQPIAFLFNYTLTSQTGIHIYSCKSREKCDGWIQKWTPQDTIVTTLWLWCDMPFKLLSSYLVSGNWLLMA